MTASEARDARLALKLSEDALAAETNTTAAIVAAWESGRIKVPRHIAVDLTWRVAQAERFAALEAAGLPQCPWVEAFEAERVPEKLADQNAHFERLLAHGKSCDVCKARAAYVDERFPPMPPAPLPAWMTVVRAIGTRIEALPRWARPAVSGAIFFGAYSLFRLIFLVPAIVRSPRTGLVTALEGLLLSMSLGAALGFLYGLYQRLREGWAARRTA